MPQPLLVRMTTIPASLKVLLKGQLIFMQQNGFEVLAVSADGAEVKELKEQEACDHIAVPLTRKISPLKDLVALIALIRLFRKIKPSIVHTHTPKAGLVGMWAAKLAGVPVRMHTIAGLPWMESKGVMRWVLKQVEKITAMPALKVYPNSERMRSFLEAEGLPAEKMKVLGSGSSNGIDSGYFSVNDEMKLKADELRKQTNIKEDGWIWIFAGRIVTDKGMGELFDAFSELHDQYPNDQLWILGEEEPELDPLAEKHRKILYEHPAIIRWGFQKDVRPYMAAADVLAFPSYREGFPNVPMQAGAMGCALILSDINGCNEIVDDGKNGLLVPAKSTEALQKAMFALRGNKDKRDSYASAIRQKIESSFDQQKIWKAILGEYEYWLNKTGNTR